jgi:hypothetical protein
MKRRRVFVGVLAVLVLAAGLGWFLWPRDTSIPHFRIKITRQTVEQGKPVVWFCVQGGGGIQFQLVDVERIAGELNEGPFEGARLSYDSPFSSGPKFGLLPPKVTLGTQKENFWAPSQVWPLLDRKRGRQPFGLLSPTNAPIWKIRVTVAVERQSLGHRLKNLKDIPVYWKDLRRGAWRQEKSSVLAATLKAPFLALGRPEGLHRYVVESDFITNTVANP